MQQIDEETLTLARKIVETQFTSPLESVSQIIDKGEVNHVFVLTLIDSRKYILRINDASEEERFKKEKWCAEVTQARGVHGAKVLSTGVEQGSAFMLLEYIEGTNGTEINSTPEIWEKLGKYLKVIHSVSTAGFGENLEDIHSGSRNQWEQYLEYNIRSLDNSDQLIKMAVLTLDTSSQLSKLFEGMLSTDYKFGLNHGDYSLANVIISENDTPHIIDWGSAQAHVMPHYDLSVIVDESLDEQSDEFAALLSGYGLSSADYSAMRSDINKLQLLESVDKLRWAIDKSPESIEHFKERVTNYLSDNGIS